MDDQAQNPNDFWVELERNVTYKVEIALNKGGFRKDTLVSYLRDLEVTARTECDRRQTIQVIASGRHLLGDHTVLGPHDGPFTRALT